MKIFFSFWITLFFATHVCASDDIVLTESVQRKARGKKEDDIFAQPRDPRNPRNPRTPEETIVMVIERFNLKAPTERFAVDFFGAKKQESRQQVCRDIHANVVSQWVSRMSQKLNTTITIDIGVDANYAVVATEFALSLIWGEGGQVACSQNVGIGLTIGLLGAGASVGISISPASLRGWESVGASWQKPALCLSLGYSKIVGIAGTVAIDLTLIDLNEAIDGITEIFNETFATTDSLDEREVFLEAFQKLIGVVDDFETLIGPKVVGIINVGIEFNIGIDLLDSLEAITLWASPGIPDVQIVACTERLTWCNGTGCDEKVKVGKRGETCLDEWDCEVQLYCNRGVCYDGTDGDRCSFDFDCQSGICHPFQKICTSGLQGSICAVNNNCKNGNTCRGFECSNGLVNDKCTLHLDCVSNICYPATKRCSNGNELDACGISRHCKGSNYCKDGRCYDGTDGDPCVLHSNCDSTICYPATKRCSAGNENDRCGLSRHCKGSNYCKDGRCYDGTDGDPCVLHSNCDSNICYPATKRCSAGTHGSTCTLHNHCKSGYYCNRSRCYNGSPGDRCSLHRDCKSNNCPWRTKVCK